MTMGKVLQMVLLSLFVLFLAVNPVEAYTYYYGGTWYIYIIVVFVVIAISSCIGACVRYKRNQMILEQRNMMLAQGAVNVTATTTSASTGALNHGYYAHPGSYPTQQYPQGAVYPPTGMQQPPAYSDGQAGATPVKDPNLPPAYDDAVSAPSQPGGDAPYPPMSAPYPTQGAPYPTQGTPYPPQP